MDKCSTSLKAYAIEEYEEKTQLKKGINNSKKRKEVDEYSKKYKNQNKIKKYKNLHKIICFWITYLGK